jgi:carbon-monoxide dehydrogenase small subunit
MKKLISLTVNKKGYEVAVAPNKTLAQLLREDLNLLGTKIGCGIGDCGACTVIWTAEPLIPALFWLFRQRAAL